VLPLTLIVQTCGYPDHDADNVLDGTDNCPDAANPSQSDVDQDGVGDVCDNCPALSNSSQGDADADGAGDVCDNCVSVRNEGQSDLDHDGQGDACDLNDGLILFTSITRARLDWQNESGFQKWNLYRSSLERLRATAEYTQDPAIESEAARFCLINANAQNDSHVPPAGRTDLYLVTGVHAGAESTLGTNSSGSTRPNTHPCP
jgi:hypothetical protein